jgi:hypothetical protein
MVVNRLQNGLINSSIAPWASRVNCQNIFFQMGLHIFFLVILIEIFILKTTTKVFYLPEKVLYRLFLVHIIDSNSKSDEEMSNTPPDIADENRNT